MKVARIERSPSYQMGKIESKSMNAGNLTTTVSTVACLARQCNRRETSEAWLPLHQPLL